MRLMVSNRPGGSKVRLGGSIQPSDREDVLEKLTAALNMGEELILDLSGITDMDTQAVQILLCIRKEAERQNKKIIITSVSEPVRGIAAAYHISAAFAVHSG